MVDIILQCQGVESGHEFRKTFADPVDWNLLSLYLKSLDPRCDLHPEFYSCDWE